VKPKVEFFSISKITNLYFRQRETERERKGERGRRRIQITKTRSESGDITNLVREYY
jgi:hypothetical protein